MSFNASEILNFENYCALAVSIYGHHMVCPEIAFEKMGMNKFVTKEDHDKFKWKVHGPLFWKELAALREIGFSWREIANYYQLTTSSAVTIYCKNRKKYTGDSGRDGFAKGRERKTNENDRQSNTSRIV